MWLAASSIGRALPTSARSQLSGPFEVGDVNRAALGVMKFLAKNMTVGHMD